MLVSMFLLSVNQMSYAKRSAYLGACNGTKLPYNTARKACKSGKYTGQTVLTCNRKGKQKDRRICNSDGKKAGVYVDSCSGSATGYKLIDKACKTGKFNNKLLVKCRKGKEKRRRQCTPASKNDKQVVLFLDQCGSSSRIKGRNLLKACRNNPGQKIAKCARKRNIWKERKSMICVNRRDRIKFRKCSPSEQTQLLSDFKIAEQKVDSLRTALANELRNNKGIGKKLRKKLKVVQRKLRKIKTAFGRKRVYVCKSNKGMCHGANAHTLALGTRKVKLCDNYFAKGSQLERASIVVHEASHYKTQTNDKGAYETCSGVKPKASENFQRRAEYYEHIVECGLYIPK